jgi:hypothetical protein
MPFKSYKKDLEKLYTFRSMISKVTTELGLNIITDGVLMAITFAIDLTERKLMLSNLDFVNKVIQLSRKNPSIQS